MTKRIGPKERDAARIAARSPQASKSAARGVSLAPISFGELIDKITILKIKAQRIHDPAKASNIRSELQLLTEARAHFSTGGTEIDQLEAKLERTNEELWDIENHIRDCERQRDFGPRFVELARSVYRTNDRRAELKRQINEIAGSSIVEEKSYSRY